MIFLVFFVLNLFIFLSPLSAFAHSGQMDGFSSGFFHPLLGFDHLLAMICIGVISVQMGRSYIWSLPGAFLLSLFLGGVLGIYNLGTFPFEQGIMVSMILLGGMMVWQISIYPLILYTLVVLFGFFHGYAHGLEIPYMAVPWMYVAGFLLSSLCLHVLGMLIAKLFLEFSFGSALLRVLGLAVCCTGVGFLFSI